MKISKLNFKWLVAITLTVIPFFAFAEVATPVLSKGLEPSGHIWQIIMSLSLILVLIFMSAWLVKRFGRVNGLASDKMQVLANMAVGQRERIILLEIGDEQLLIGVTSSRVSLLHQLKEPIEVAKPTNIAVGLGQNFSEKLQEAMQSKNKNKSDNEKGKQSD